MMSVKVGLHDNEVSYSVAVQIEVVAVLDDDLSRCKDDLGIEFFIVKNLSRG
jgi:hypothetical protein